MGRAVVIFSDGSKRMAHNTDDRNLRWGLRKDAESEAFMEAYINGIYVRDCSNPPDIDTGDAWHNELVKQKIVIVQYMSYMKNTHGKWYQTKSQAHTTLHEIELQMANIKRVFRNKPNYRQRLRRALILVADGGTEDGLDEFIKQERLRFNEELQNYGDGGTFHAPNYLKKNQ